MKYVLPLLFLLGLIACQPNVHESQDKTSEHSPVLTLTKTVWTNEVLPSCVDSLRFRDEHSGMAYTCELTVHDPFTYKVEKNIIHLELFVNGTDSQEPGLKYQLREENGKLYIFDIQRKTENGYQRAEVDYSVFVYERVK